MMRILPAVLGIVVGSLVVGLSAVLGGWAGLLYLGVFLLWLLPGPPIAALVFGDRHPAMWVAGAVLGYPITTFALWTAKVAGAPTPAGFTLAWAAVTVSAWGLCWPFRGTRVPLRAWTRGDAAAFGLALLLVPLLVGRPFSRVGERDQSGARLYRAYFTADFLWHMALTAELEKYAPEPHNPYLDTDTLHYYWLYFMPPAAAATALAPVMPSREARLAINATGAGLLLISAIFLAAWCAVPRAGPVAVGVALAVLAPSAEGLYLVIDQMRQGHPLAVLREINVDAVTSWFFGAFTIDGLQRSMLYNPQHSMGCAAGLVAVAMTAAAGAALEATSLLVAGSALGLGLMMSPFPGGALTLAFGVAMLADVVLSGQERVRRLVRLSIAGLPLAGALAWSVANRTFEGAGHDLHVGLAHRAMAAPVTALALALGPLLLLVGIGLARGPWRTAASRLRPAAAALGIALTLLYFVTLDSADVWIGWRAGQVLLVSAPALAAAGAAWLYDSRYRRVGIGLIVLLFAVGLPTTALDVFNAQDVETRTMGPGFRWTVAISADEQAALAWIREHTRPEAIVQMEPTVRGRETWTLIPSFAERRMAAGLPISLLTSPAYEVGSARVREIYETPDPELAWSIARELGIDYLYVDRVEREHYPDADAKFERRRDLFAPVFGNEEVRLFWVLPHPQ